MRQLIVLLACPDEAARTVEKARFAASFSSPPNPSAWSIDALRNPGRVNDTQDEAPAEHALRSAPMPTPETSLAALLRTLDAVRVPGIFVYVSGDELPPEVVFATVREAEGVCAVIQREEALARGLPFSFEAAWLSLTVHSALEAVGLTAAVARALADEGIACNVLAGLHHDHLLVQAARSDDALACLKRLRVKAP